MFRLFLLPSGWLEESDPAGVILYVMDGPYHLLFQYRTGWALTGAASGALMAFPAAVI
jgi:hypothetical protein